MNENRWFQWIMGDRKDQICIFDRIESEDGVNYIVFTDKSRINEMLVSPLNHKDLTGKYMAEIDHPNNKWVFKEEWVGRQEEVWEWRDETNPTEKVCVQPFIEGRKVTKLIPPKPTAPRTSAFGRISNAPMQNQPVVEQPPKKKPNEDDPIYILMNKSKKNDTEVSMTLTISLPSKSLYSIAKESFDDASEKFVGYIIESIEVKDIKDALKVAITEMYETEASS